MKRFATILILALVSVSAYQQYLQMGVIKCDGTSEAERFLSDSLRISGTASRIYREEMDYYLFNSRNFNENREMYRELATRKAERYFAEKMDSLRQATGIDHLENGWAYHFK